MLEVNVFCVSRKRVNNVCMNGTCLNAIEYIVLSDDA